MESWDHWWWAPIFNYIAGPEDIANALAQFPDHSFSTLVISGHGSNGGVSMVEPFTPRNITQDDLNRIKAKLKPNAHIWLTACAQAPRSNEMQSLADMFGATIHATSV